MSKRRFVGVGLALLCACVQAQTTAANPAVEAVKPGFNPPGLQSAISDLGLGASPTVRPDMPVKVAPTTPSEPVRQSGKRKPIVSTWRPAATTAASGAIARLERPRVVPDVGEGPIDLRGGKMPDVAIAIGEFNRFSTELQNVALSASNHNLEVMGAGGAFLLQTTDDRPFVAVLKDRDDASRSAMVRFVPTRGIAARDVNITGFPMGGEKPGATAPKPISDAFEVEAKTLLKAVVLRQMPRGFALAKGRGGSADVCRLPGTTTSEAQILESAHFRIRVFALTNDGPDGAEIDEAQCDGQSVLAATSWPQRQLKHGDRIELFVLEAKTQAQPNVAVRPSAI